MIVFSPSFDYLLSWIRISLFCITIASFSCSNLISFWFNYKFIFVNWLNSSEVYSSYVLSWWLVPKEQSNFSCMYYALDSVLANFILHCFINWYSVSSTSTLQLLLLALISFYSVSSISTLTLFVLEESSKPTYFLFFFVFFSNKFLSITMLSYLMHLFFWSFSSLFSSII